MLDVLSDYMGVVGQKNDMEERHVKKNMTKRKQHRLTYQFLKFGLVKADHMLKYATCSYYLLN